ncbi:MAG: MBL fold metallo-hydrolase [Spirochaetes bacterium]|nr:MBL fold metallo-hydrolase [Spirochaetota bacterium]
MSEKKVTSISVGEIATNCWIYQMGDGCAIIDPGSDAPKIISAVKRLGLAPRYILLTHGHFDHIAALPDLFQEYCAGKGDGRPQIAIGSGDAQYLGGSSYERHREAFKIAAGNASYIDKYWKDMPEADILLNEGDTLGDFTVLNLPGHTPGSLAFWDKEAAVLFTGDTLFHCGWGRTDLPGGNEGELKKSLIRIFKMDGGTAVFPGHGSSTTVADEAKRY